MNSSPVVTYTDVSQNRHLFDKIFEFKYKGHQYIWFCQHIGGTPFGGIVHNPECSACRGAITKADEKLEGTALQYGI